jgi:hypothetical protein
MNAIVAGTDKILFSQSVIYVTAATRLSGYLGMRGWSDCPSENCRLTSCDAWMGKATELPPVWKSTLDAAHHVTCVDH